MGTRVTRYRSFLLRVWHAGDARHSQWRASLEDICTRKVVGFTRREALLDFLRQLDEEDTTHGAPVAGMPNDVCPAPEPDSPNRNSKEIP